MLSSGSKRLYKVFNNMTEEEEDKEQGTTTPAAETTPTAEETTPATPPETAPTHRYADRLTKAYPDRKFEKPEDYDTGMDEYLTGLEGYKEKGQALNTKLLALFEAEPQIGEVIRDMINGASFREALARHISPEDLTAIEGDPDYEGWNRNRTAREESAAKRKQFETDYSNNLQVSQADTEKFAEENGLDEKAVGELLTNIDGLLADFHQGKITKDALSRMLKAFRYEEDVKTAEETGTIKGRNEQIVARKEAESTNGDGLPRPAKTVAPPAETPKKGTLQALEELASKKELF